MNDSSAERAFYTSEYWFDNPKHEDCADFGPGYFANDLYRSLITRLDDVPGEGYIVVLGTNRCVSFDLLCEHFGAERCLGFDVHNPAAHPRVVIRDCSTLSPADAIPIAFCHNDVGSFPATPLLKAHCQRWAAANTVPGGYVLSRNNRNQARFDVEGCMAGAGFDIRQLAELAGRYDLSALDADCLESHMLAHRRSPCTSR